MAEHSSVSAPVSTSHSPAPSTDASAATTDDVPTTEKTPDETSKLKTFLGILRKFIGVSDMAAVRFSLPAQLMEPIPNLEYWHYLDRPETFVSIGDSDDELGRFLEVLRFWFTKDLKFVKGRPCKPYNSTLGEFFRCCWDVSDSSPPVYGTTHKKSAIDESDTTDKTVRVSFLTEQTSHHPPVSAFVVDCPTKGITARGFDQISAKFTGTAIRVSPGQHNEGIYITLGRRDNEEYHLTHPTASLGGFLRGNLAISVADTCYVTCPKTKLKAVLHYQEEGWLGKSQNKVTGVVFKYDPDDDTVTRIKDVPSKSIVARVEGSWHEKMFYTLADEKDSNLLIDLEPLQPVPKTVPPEDEQHEKESRRYWKDVTNAIQSKQFGAATKAKQTLEENERQLAAERTKNNNPFQPRFFTETLTPKGRPELSKEGKGVLAKLERGVYSLAAGLGAGMGGEELRSTG